MLIRREQRNEFDFHGLTVGDYGALGDSGASVAIVEVPPSGRHPFAYSSRCDKLYLVLRGKLRFNVGGVIYRPRVGDCVLVEKTVVFAYHEAHGKQARLLLVHSPAFDAEAEHLLPNEIRRHDVRLTGSRVSLRPMTEDDWDHVLAWNADPEVLIWSDDTTEIRPKQDTKDIYREVSLFGFVFIIEFEGESIGECWLQKMNLLEVVEQFPGRDLRRIDIMIGRTDLWGQGLGTDTIRTLVEFGFGGEGADAIFGMVDPKNVRSWRAFQKAGFDEWHQGDERGLVVWRPGA